MCTCANTYNGGHFRHLVNHLEAGHVYVGQMPVYVIQASSWECALGTVKSG